MYFIDCSCMISTKTPHVHPFPQLITSFVDHVLTLMPIAFFAPPDREIPIMEQ